MRKLISYLTIAAIALGFAACNNEDVPNPETGKGDTYVGLTIKFPVASTTRALPDDYNKQDGTWQGRDVIKGLTVYVVNTTEGAIDKTSFPQTAFHGITADGELNPKLAVEATAGHNVRAYVVINDVNNKVTDLLNDASVTAANFATKFDEAVAQVTAVTNVATTEGTGINTKDIVVMTNKVMPTDMTVQANITEAQAINGPTNQMKVEVSRVAARGIVTIKDGYTTAVNVKNNEGTTTSVITIQDVQYQVTGSALQFNVLEDRTNWQVPTDVYGYIPTSNNSTWPPTNPSPANIMLYTDATSWKPVIAKASNANANVIAALGEEEYSKFVLPVTHADANYKKGNTTMFEIKATFTPDSLDGAVWVGGNTPATVYLGMKDGLFYSTKAKAEEMDASFTGGTAVNHKQDVREYTGGTMYYYLWLNPNKAYGGAEKITMSPTVRNQVYHAHITGFAEIGVANKDEIDPDDPLQTDKTYISVQLKVLPWTIHSYTVELGNYY
jgi:hypothetical protein